MTGQATHGPAIGKRPAKEKRGRKTAGQKPGSQKSGLISGRMPPREPRGAGRVLNSTGQAPRHPGPTNQTYMKQNLMLKSLLLAAAFGLAGAARAADGLSAATVPPSGTMGLLGQTYAGLTYSYIDLNNSSSHRDDYRFDYNQTLNPGLDGVLSYDFAQAGSDRQQALVGALRSFCTNYTWGKPYVEAGAGYTWERFDGGKDNSLLWELAVGAEFQVAPAVTITPFVKYTGTPDLARRNEWDYGVKANYWVDSQWAVTVGLARTNHQDMAYTVGTNFRF
jgi:hypothetical protein